MAEEIPFIKMHGCGNDYVYLDGFSCPVPDDLNGLAQVVSHRHFGIGSDGLVVMLPDGPDRFVARMRMFNADGSEGSLCGNALRCMAMWLHQHQQFPAEFTINMGRRAIAASVRESDAEQRTATVAISIGVPEEVSPEQSGRRAFVREISLPGVPLPPLLHPPLQISFGNPHTVLFVRSLAEIPFTQLGPLIEKYPAFPDGTNVEFVELCEPSDHTSTPLLNRRLRPDVHVRVWERGSGETLACGSGACAVAVAAMVSGQFSGRESVRVAMKGGDLKVTWDSGDQLILEGAAAESFRGVFRR